MKILLLCKYTYLSGVLVFSKHSRLFLGAVSFVKPFFYFSISVTVKRVMRIMEPPVALVLFIHLFVFCFWSSYFLLFFLSNWTARGMKINITVHWPGKTALVYSGETMAEWWRRWVQSWKCRYRWITKCYVKLSFY